MKSKNLKTNGKIYVLTLLVLIGLLIPIGLVSGGGFPELTINAGEKRGDKGDLDDLDVGDWKPPSVATNCSNAQSKVLEGCRNSGKEAWIFIRSIKANGEYVQNIVSGGKDCPSEDPYLSKENGEYVVKLNRNKSVKIISELTDAQVRIDGDSSSVTCDFLCAAWDCSNGKNESICKTEIWVDLNGDGKHDVNGKTKGEFMKSVEDKVEEECNKRGNNCILLDKNAKFFMASSNTPVTKFGDYAACGVCDCSLTGTKQSIVEKSRKKAKWKRDIEGYGEGIELSSARDPPSGKCCDPKKDADAKEPCTRQMITLESIVVPHTVLDESENGDPDPVILVQVKRLAEDKCPHSETFVKYIDDFDEDKGLFVYNISKPYEKWVMIPVSEKVYDYQECFPPAGVETTAAVIETDSDIWEVVKGMGNANMGGNPDGSWTAKLDGSYFDEIYNYLKRKADNDEVIIPKGVFEDIIENESVGNSWKDRKVSRHRMWSNIKRTYWFNGVFDLTVVTYAVSRGKCSIPEQSKRLLKPYIEDRTLQADFVTTGSASGHVADLTITSNADGPLTISIKPSGLEGMILINPNKDEQDLVITRIPGVSTGPTTYRPADNVTLNPNESVTLPVIGSCANMSKKNPSEGMNLTLNGPIGDNVPDVIGALENTEFPENFTQGDIQIITQITIWMSQPENKDKTPEDYEIRGYPIKEEYKPIIKDILNETGTNTEEVVALTGKKKEEKQPKEPGIPEIPADNIPWIYIAAAAGILAVVGIYKMLKK